MKNLLSSALVLIFGMQLAFASEASVFDYNEQAFMNEFSDMEMLEQYVDDHPGVTLSEMRAQNHSLAFTCNATPASFNQYMSPLGIPGFWWGCFLGPIGVLVVVISEQSESRDLTNSVIGCIISCALFGGGVLLNG